MAMAPTQKLILGSIAFAVFWVLAVFPAVPLLPIGRTAGSLLGGMLMVLFQVITPDQAYAAIDLPILGLLFGTMVVSAFLERAEVFKYLGKLLSWRSLGPRDLLCRICLISAVSSALFTNDTSCIVLTEFVLKIARQQNLPPHPFLLALASSANIGSSATPIGNPQNLVIAVQSGIRFGEFLMGVLPAMLVGIVVNALILLCMFWKVLVDRKDEEDACSEVVDDGDVVSHRFSPVTMSHLASVISPELNGTSEAVNVHTNPTDSSLWNRSGSSAEIAGIQNTLTVTCQADTEIPKGIDTPRKLVVSKEASGSLSVESKRDTPANGIPQYSDELEEGKLSFSEKWKMTMWKSGVYLITIGMLIALLMGLNMSWTAITAALALLVLDFKDARPCLEKVSYSLLVFFCGMFITVDGFNKTGIPGKLWDLIEPYAKIDHIGGTILLATMIILLSNLASNVPTVLLLGGRVAASAAAISPGSEKRAWLLLAWVSTVAGNLSLLGSAANLIVCEQARRAKPCSYNLSFWTHLKFGVPSTIIVTVIGLTLIRG